MNGQCENVALSLSHALGSPLASVIAAARRLGAAGGNAVIYGEPGTGRDALARAIHEASDASAQFLILRTRGRDERAIAHDLFGAPDVRDGVIARASGGTLFIEDIDELPPELQGRLAQRWAEAHRFRADREGNPPRLISSSTRELLPLVAGGAFRRDLFDLLSTKLRLPPLRERRGDIVAVVDRAWSSLAEHRTVAEGALALLQQYPWPGNARELVGFVQRLAANSTASVISVRDVERELFMMTTGLSCWGPVEDASASGQAPGEPPAAAARRVLLEAGLAFARDDERVDLPAVLRGVEAGLIDWALRRADGNKAVAAQLLGMHRTTLVEKLRRRRCLQEHAPLGDGAGPSAHLAPTHADAGANGTLS